MTVSSANHYLIMDMHNILHRAYFVSTSQAKGQDLIGLVFHTTLMSMNKLYRDHKPTKMVLAFDKGESWRLGYTQSEDCVSKKIYKANRRLGMTRYQKDQYIAFRTSISSFYELLDEHTKIACIRRDLAEADDLIAHFVSEYQNDEITIVSSDNDLLQLLKFKNVSIIDPDNGKKKTLSDYNNSVDWFLFQKCVRGDVSDNIQSAYPGVRKTRIRKAFEDGFERTNLMNESWTRADGAEFVVRDLFDENELLVDLFKAPDIVQSMSKKIISAAMNQKKEFSYMHLLRFLKKHELKTISEKSDQFVPMFAS